MEKRREEKISLSIFLLCLFLPQIGLETKEQKTLFLFLQTSLILPSEFLEPQFPLLLRQGSKRSTLHHLGEPRVQ